MSREFRIEYSELRNGSLPEPTDGCPDWDCSSIVQFTILNFQFSMISFL
jgi:hypothetical protein